MVAGTATLIAINFQSKKGLNLRTRKISFLIAYTFSILAVSVPVVILKKMNTVPNIIFTLLSFSLLPMAWLLPNDSSDTISEEGLDVERELKDEITPIRQKIVNLEEELEELEKKDSPTREEIKELKKRLDEFIKADLTNDTFRNYNMSKFKDKKTTIMDNLEEYNVRNSYILSFWKYLFLATEEIVKEMNFISEGEDVGEEEINARILVPFADALEDYIIIGIQEGNLKQAFRKIGTDSFRNQVGLSKPDLDKDFIKSRLETEIKEFAKQAKDPYGIGGSENEGIQRVFNDIKDDYSSAWKTWDNKTTKYEGVAPQYGGFIRDASNKVMDKQEELVKEVLEVHSEDVSNYSIQEKKSQKGSLEEKISELSKELENVRKNLNRLKKGETESSATADKGETLGLAHSAILVSRAHSKIYEDSKGFRKELKHFAEAML